MKIPPKKPHFFKPILPGFKHGIKIPIAFSKYLNGCNQEHAILRRAGKKWVVKVNGQLLEQGWGKFAEEHDLQLGDCLVFRHEGNMEFEVSIFGSSKCEREYEQHLEGVNEEQEENNHSFKKFTSQANTTERPKLKIRSSHKAFPNAEAAQDMPLDRPHFIYTIKPYCLSKSFLQLPGPFARENDLRNRKCTITIRDEQMSWTFSLYSSGSHTFIGGAWSKFCIANGFKEGDQIMLEIVENGKNPILKVYDLMVNASHQREGKKTYLDAKSVSTEDLRANASLQREGKKANLDARRVTTRGRRIKTSDMPATTTRARLPASTSANANPHFISTIRPYFISRPSLYLPAAFAKSNGLANKRRQLILRDEKQRSWPVQVGPQGHHFAITRGWRQFREANNVQVGDTYKFELIDNGTVPVAHFHCKYSGKDAKHQRSY
ncbi:PREDICTED: B3 domain-containing protein REM17-like isoform X2 [Nicotiana attenuata]|uniref:B3 domain-containing protein REM17-like isoform X2 n=1 Tax=Nicotiana attenuata TaxID=49451 RepID=UPI000905787F|nr:PREDICTED: B3 domain-containing protein REM17-like isoform X2 [Nicotiana attenuata]